MQKRKVEIFPETLKKLENSMLTELDFYNFIYQRVMKYKLS